MPPRKLSEEAPLLDERIGKIRAEAVAADAAMISGMRAACLKALEAEVGRIREGQMSPRFAPLLKTMMREDVEKLVNERNQKKRIERQLQAAERLKAALLAAPPQQLYAALSALSR